MSDLCQKYSMLAKSGLIKEYLYVLNNSSLPSGT